MFFLVFSGLGLKVSLLALLYTTFRIEGFRLPAGKRDIILFNLSKKPPTKLIREICEYEAAYLWAI